MSTRNWRDGIRADFERWQIARVRDAYRGGTRVEARPGPPFEAMVAEMQQAQGTATAEQRSLADHRVLRSIFFAPVGPALLRWLARRWPLATTTLLARASPISLRFLVGDLHVTQPATNRVPRCAFRARGGEQLCQQVCQRPSEAFTATHGFPVRLEPDRDGEGCTWTWGEAR